VRDIIITHAHLDHIKAIPFLADNIIIKNKRHSIKLFGVRETLAALKKHLLNNKIWPDFTKISSSLEPVIKLETITTGKSFAVNGYTAHAYRVNHTVPAVGYILCDRQGKALLYTGDTGPTDAIWNVPFNIDAVIVEVSFPNRLEKLAVKTGHLTARLLKREMEKMRFSPKKIFITHPKPQYLEQISREIREVRDRKKVDMRIVKEGESYQV
ncbi:MAG: 3',5'-cyclic-nucleotide phosphodiesterase, partial [Nitrospirota bacterium]|nr:3',5'-cyclic-nucleotide phosphodiesterase [Nitrospirota bacterium]